MAHKVNPHPASRSPESELVRLQQTLYTSRNSTRRWLHISRYDWIRSAIERHSVPDGEALEVGPGSGIYLPLLAARFQTVTALDIEQEYLDSLSIIIDKHANITPHIGDITNSTLNDKVFDLVLCSEVLEHISNASGALQEIARILKPGGVLILSTPQPFCPLELAANIAFYPGIRQVIRLIYREPLLPLGHVNLQSARIVRKSLIDSGFTIIEQHTGGVYLPLVSEFLGGYAVRFQKLLEKAVRGTPFELFLWTQFYVARINPR
jgi:2-polyprenyl-3-methyl-5-hydroxy-6-metoxy-1,4-benzoquinol methylase